jgi:hypothetical protein
MDAEAAPLCRSIPNPTTWIITGLVDYEDFFLLTMLGAQ